MIGEHPTAERVALANVAYKHDVSAGELEHVVEIESGWDPRAINRKSGTVGIVQWTDANLKRLGTSRNEVLDMSFVEQCDLVDRYLDGVKHPIGDDVYMCFAAPGHIGNTAETVVYPVDKAPRSAWSLNPGWRSTGGGPITAGSIRAYAANAKRSKGHPSQTSGMGVELVLILLLLVSRSRRR